jgi:hypothetical protein
MKAPALIALFCVLGGTGSAWSQAIYEKKDTFDGTTHYFTKNRDARLEGGSFVSMRYVHFSLHAFSPLSNPSAPYLLEVGTMTPGWIFISAGGSSSVASCLSSTCAGTPRTVPLRPCHPEVNERRHDGDYDQNDEPRAPVSDVFRKAAFPEHPQIEPEDNDQDNRRDQEPANKTAEGGSGRQ